MVSGPEIDPAALERVSFEVVRRGYEPMAVQRELQQAAAAIRALQREVATLQAQLAELDVPPTEQLEARRVAEALGAEATQVLDAAHVAAVERGERADREAEAVRVQASADADTSRREAMAERDRIVAAAGQEAEQIVEEGRQRGREMVNEAQVVRQRMLGDLARKRQTGRAQIEQLRAGRDRLLESLVISQQNLDQAVKDLVDAVPEARGAAERAGLRVANEPTPTVEVMEAEIEAARLVGHPLVEGVPEPRAADVDGPDEPDPAFVTSEMEALTHVDAALDGEAEAGGDAADQEPESVVVDAVAAEQDEADEDDAEPGSADEDVAEHGEVVQDTAEEDTAEEHTTAAVDDAPEAVDGRDDTAVDGDGVELEDMAAPAEPEAADETPDADPVVDAADGGAERHEGAVDDGADLFDQDEAADAEPDAGGVDADDIFARLRESRSGDDELDDAEVSEPAAVIDLTGELDEAVDDEAVQPVSDTDMFAEPEPQPEPDDVPAPDPHAQAVERAVSDAVRAAKKVLVVEQGTLLDGIRVSGGEAIGGVIEDEDAHAGPYEDAVEPALQVLIEELGGMIDDDIVGEGLAQIRVVALDPVRHRLQEVATESDQADELTDTVRGLYRESRSRRLPDAVSAAVTVVCDAVALQIAAGEGP